VEGGECDYCTVHGASWPWPVRRSTPRSTSSCRTRWCSH